jgi:actin-related protein
LTHNCLFTPCLLRDFANSIALFLDSNQVSSTPYVSLSTEINSELSFNEIVESVQNDPFIPIAWQKDNKGIQESKYITVDKDTYGVEDTWLESRNRAIELAKSLNKQGVNKQLCVNLLKPFMWTTMLITGNKEDWDNFIELNCPQYEYSYDGKTYKSKKDFFVNCKLIKFDTNSNLDWLQINKNQLEVHIMTLAECIYDAINESEI